MNVRSIACLLMLLAGCKNPRQKHEAQARTVLTRLPSFAALATKAPPSTEATAAPLRLLNDFSVKYQHSNALLIHLEELENPTVRWQLPVRLNQRSPAADVANALGLVKQVDVSKLEPAYDPACPDDSTDWGRLGGLKYLLVVRTEAHDAAKLGSNNTFEAGGWAGDVLVFDFDKSALLGGFPLVASHHSRVRTDLGRDQQNLNADLQLAARGNLNAELRRVIPAVGASDELN